MLLVCMLVAAALPSHSAAMVMDTRTGPVSGAPLLVLPSAGPYAWVDTGAVFDFAPTAMTLSDGGRWHRQGFDPRWIFSTGLSLRRGAAAILFGGRVRVFGIAVQLGAMRRGDVPLGVTATALATADGWDLSLTPAYSFAKLSVSAKLLPFVAIRLRAAKTLYDVQGWTPDRSNPYAAAKTRDVALAPMVGLAAPWRSAELRVTAGWEQLLVDDLRWEARPTALSRSSGPFVLVQLRGTLAARGLR